VAKTLSDKVALLSSKHPWTTARCSQYCTG